MSWTVVLELAALKHRSEQTVIDYRHGDFAPAASGVYPAFGSDVDIAASLLAEPLPDDERVDDAPQIAVP